VNTTTDSIPSDPGATALADGGWLVSWTSHGQDGNGAGIYQQRYSAGGEKAGAETRVNTETAHSESAPAVTSLADGGWLVSWMSHGQLGQGYGIHQQRYTAAGVAIGGEVRVNTTVGDQFFPKVTALADGGWLVGWASRNQEDTEWDVYQQRYTAAGLATGGEVRVHTKTHGNLEEPSVTGLADGGWLVSWTSEGQDGDGGGIFQRRFDASGAALDKDNRLTGDDAANTLVFSGATSIELAGRGGSDMLRGGSGNDLLDGGAGNDSLVGGTGFDTALWGKAASSYTLSFSGDTLMVSDKTAADGTDSLSSIEALQFADKTVIVESQAHGSYADLPVELYHFFIVAFNGAPGVAYMNQLAEAYRYGLTVKQIVDIFTTKTQFTDVYPTSLSHQALATELVNQIVKNSADASAKAAGIANITEALDYGLSVGEVIYNVFGNLATLPKTDPAWNAVWGNTARQFDNEIAVARVYTEVLNQSTTDLATLRDVLAQVDAFTDVSSQQVIVTLIGQALMQG
jgi:hypothetical protein